jgi:hypothetical protein
MEEINGRVDAFMEHLHDKVLIGAMRAIGIEAEAH